MAALEILQYMFTANLSPLAIPSQNLPTLSLPSPPLPYNMAATHVPSQVFQSPSTLLLLPIIYGRHSICQASHDPKRWGRLQPHFEGE